MLVSGVSGGSGMWYYDGKFFEVKTTHANFLIENYDLFGISKQELLEELKMTELPAEIDDNSDERVGIVTLAMKKGAIRIRFYRDRTSVQCWDIKKNRKDLVNCLIDGYKKDFGSVLTVMDCHGWGEHLSDYWGKSIKQFMAESKVEKKQHFEQILYKELVFYRISENIRKES